MLTSIGKPETINPSLEANFAGFLTKPIKQSQLYDVLMQVLGGQPIKVLPSSRLEEINPHLAEHLPLRILLAEDNLVNQQVALHLLQRMGYRADVAGNGLEVLEALSRQPYDVVLMDVQMPEMDGLTATRHILSEQSSLARPRIIAMTGKCHAGRSRNVPSGWHGRLRQQADPSRGTGSCLKQVSRGGGQWERNGNWGRSLYQSPSTTDNLFSFPKSEIPNSPCAGCSGFSPVT
jgi:CheY-like chemotaxis protein